MVFFIFTLVFYFILVYSGYVMDIGIFIVTVFYNLFYILMFLAYMFAVLLFAFMLGGFLIAILGYFRVKRLENPEILQKIGRAHV